MRRYTIIELTKTTDDELLLDIVADYCSKFSNPYTPLAQRVKAIRNKLSDRILCSNALKNVKKK